MNFIWLYQIPNWLLCAVVVSAFAAASLVGLWLTRPWVSTFKTHHNDIIASFAASIGVLYAVLLAMIAVASWTNYTTMDSLSSEEADHVHALFRDAEGFPQPEQHELRLLLRDYVDTVITVEWPALQRGVTDERAGIIVDEIFSGWMHFEPKTEAQKLIVAETLQRLNSFQAVRRNRITTGTNGLDTVLWTVVLVGAVLSVGICYFFWVENKRLHQMLIGVLGLIIGVVVYLILALDHPIWGTVSVQPTAFEAVKDSMDHVLFPLTPGQKRSALR